MIGTGDAAHIAELIAFQFARISPYWISGILVGSLVSVFFSSGISAAVLRVGGARFALPKSVLAAVLGAASPVCMYGTIPLIASLSRGGAPQYILASFMVGSILINPNLFAFSFALGAPIALLRLGVCLAAGTVAGLAVRFFFRDRVLFDLGAFEDCRKERSRPTARDYAASVGRGFYKTAPYFIGGIVLTALFDQYFPREWAATSLGPRSGLGPVIAASVGVPAYLCGGGTIPLLQAALEMGMSPGSAIAFMVSGPATKLTNLGAVKILLGTRNFLLYVAFNLVFAIVSGLAIDAILGIIR
jgi:uncharacterized protein